MSSHWEIECENDHIENYLTPKTSDGMSGENKMFAEHLKKPCPVCGSTKRHRKNRQVNARVTCSSCGQGSFSDLATAEMTMKRPCSNCGKKTLKLTIDKSEPIKLG